MVFSKKRSYLAAMGNAGYRFAQNKRVKFVAKQLAKRAIKSYAKKRSQTARKTGNKRRHNRSFDGALSKYVSNGNGMTNSRFTKSYKPMKSGMAQAKNVPTDVTKNTASANYLSQYAQQNAWNSLPCLDGNDIQRIYDHAIDTNDIIYTQGSLYSTDRAKKLWLCGFRTNQLFTNCSPGTLMLYIYDLIAACDHSVEPAEAWSQGLSNAAGRAPGQEVFTFWPSHPWDSSLFSKFWKIAKTTKVEMHTGRDHQHIRQVNYNGFLPLEKAANWAAASLGTKYFRGISMHQLCVFHGTPATPDNSFSNANNPVLDRTKIAVIASEEYRSKLLMLKGKHIDYSTSMVVNDEKSYAQQNPDGQGTHTTKTTTGVNADYSFS